ncbi:pentapeptide repeat-containing protein [Leptolyngbya sp. AN03gr2]|uniref:pentapeptide repeat-containing protein n=1 Tax=unclassified Leptolyngbya TaxID=2650499 RepID=UPI003D3127E3
MELLTARLREASLKPAKTQQERVQSRDRIFDTEFEAILTVIGRRNVEQDQGQRLNLKRVDLRSLYIPPESNFANADLSEANFQNAILAKVDFANAILRDADLEQANLVAANLTKANLTDANLEGTQLMQAILENATLERSFFYYANLRGAILKAAKLQETYLRGANLQNVDLTDASLKNAAFYDLCPLWYTRHWTDEDFDEWREVNDEIYPYHEDGAPYYKPDFRGAKNLTIAQLNTVQDRENAINAIYDPQLRQALGLPDPDPKELRESERTPQ